MIAGANHTGLINIDQTAEASGRVPRWSVVLFAFTRSVENTESAITSAGPEVK